MSSTVGSIQSFLGTTRRTSHPHSAAAEYFSQSAMKPAGRTCRPRPYTPPSTSTATFRSGHAKSKRHFLVSWNLCSSTQGGAFASVSAADSFISGSERFGDVGCFPFAERALVDRRAATRRPGGQELTLFRVRLLVAKFHPLDAYVCDLRPGLDFPDGGDHCCELRLDALDVRAIGCSLFFSRHARDVTHQSPLRQPASPYIASAMAALRWKMLRPFALR